MNDEHGTATEGKRSPQLPIWQVLEQMRDKAFDVATKAGRYDGKPHVASLLMHTTGEVNEAHEAYMSSRFAEKIDVEALKKMYEEQNWPVFQKYFKNAVKSTFEDELADIVLMALSIAGYYKVDLASHVMLKCKYNELRAEHSAVSNYEDNHVK